MAHSQFLAVTFDAGGTLLTPNPSVGAVYAEIAHLHGAPPLSPTLLDTRFRQAWLRRSGFQHRRSEWAALVDEIFEGLVPVPPSQTFFPSLYDRFAEADVWHVFPDVVPALDALASAGIPMAVVSNWDERLRPLLQTLRLSSYFECLIISAEIGFSKPSPVPFEQAIRQLAVPPDQILHVGDRLDEDVAGAQSAGIQGIQIDRNRPSSPPDLVHTLTDLLPILGFPSPE